MIGHIRGTLLYKQAPQLLVDVQGVGYEIAAPMTTFYHLPEIGAEVSLFTHLSIRDDAHLLFGFSTLEERLLFRNLIRVNGVGAKMALTILSGIEADEFTHCIRVGNTERLVKLPGIGKKTAERLVIEMRDRLKDLISQDPKEGRPRPVIHSNKADDAISALIALGYKPQEASRFVNAVANDNMGSEDIIRAALQVSLGK